MMVHATRVWTHPLTRMVFSVVLALGLWATLRIYFDHQLTYNIALHMKNCAASHAIAPETLLITLEGPWIPLCNFIAHNPIATVDSTLLRRGLQEVTITPDNLHLPDTLKLTSSPATLIFVNPSTQR